MSEPRGNTDSDQEMQDLSEEENEQTEEEVEEEEEEEEEDEKPSVMGDDLEAKDPEMNEEEGDLWNNGVGVVEVKEEANVADNVVGDAKMASESDEGTETPDSVEPEAVEMKLNGGDVEKTGEEESKPVKEHLENGNKSEETKEKEVKDDEENQSDESLKKEEKAGTEDTEREEGTEHSPKYDPFLEGEGDGTEEEQAAFMRELENFHKEKCLEFKPPKFYGEGLNCLKLWRAVTRLGGYDQVTSCKLWRQVGESFKPPKTCTTISWSFRCFYEKALLEYEKHKVRTGELRVPASPFPERMAADNQTGNQASGSGRARRDAAARAMQGWHSQRLLGNGEVGDPIIKDKNSVSLFKRDKHPKNFGTLKRKKPSSLDHAAKVDRTKVKTQVEAMVVDVEQPADWVKINVKRTKDCFEVYALVPGLLREEVHVQSDPAGRLIISGEPEHLDNPWGVTPFKKVVTLPSRIDPHQTSAVVTLHGQLFVRAPFEQSDL